MSRHLIDIDLPVLTMSGEQYHAAAGLSSSMLKMIDREGWCVTARRHEEQRDSRDLVLGAAVHAVLDGTFGDKYIAAPEEFKTSTSAKFASWLVECESEGLIGLERREYETVRICGEALKQKLDPFLFGRRRHVEPSLFSMMETPHGHVPVKCRPDILQVVSRNELLYIEVKTSRTNGVSAWRSACWQYGYWLQQAHYEAVIRAAAGPDVTVRTLFAVVRKTPPVTVRFYEFSQFDADAAALRWRDLVEEYSRRMAENDWDDDSLLKPTTINLGLKSPEAVLEGFDDE